MWKYLGLSVSGFKMSSHLNIKLFNNLYIENGFNQNQKQTVLSKSNDFSNSGILKWNCTLVF